MTDKVGQNLANQPGSQGATQSAVNAETEMPDWAQKLMEQVAEISGQQRALQREQDQRVSGLQKQFDEAQSTFANAFEYAKKFEDPAEAERAWWIDQQIAQSRANQGKQDAIAQQNVGSGNPNLSGAGEVSPELLKQYGVDPQSAEYLEQVRQGKVGFEAALAIVAQRQAAVAQEGVATGASGGSGGSTTSTTTQQQVLRDQYTAELDEAQANNHGVLTPHALFSIQEKYAKLGLRF